MIFQPPRSGNGELWLNCVADRPGGHLQPGCTREKNARASPDSASPPAPSLPPVLRADSTPHLERCDLSFRSSHQRTARRFNQPAGLEAARIIIGGLSGRGRDTDYFCDRVWQVDLNPTGLGISFPSVRRQRGSQLSGRFAGRFSQADRSTGSAPPNRDASQIANGE